MLPRCGDGEPGPGRGRGGRIDYLLVARTNQQGPLMVPAGNPRFAVMPCSRRRGSFNPPFLPSP